MGRLVAKISEKRRRGGIERALLPDEVLQEHAQHRIEHFLHAHDYRPDELSVRADAPGTEVHLEKTAEIAKALEALFVELEIALYRAKIERADIVDIVAIVIAGADMGLDTRSQRAFESGVGGA